MIINKHKLQWDLPHAEYFPDIRETILEVSDPYLKRKIVIEDKVLIHSSVGFENEKGCPINFHGINNTWQINKKKGEDAYPKRQSVWLTNTELLALMSSILLGWLPERKHAGFFNTFTSETHDKFRRDDFIKHQGIACTKVGPSGDEYLFSLNLHEFAEQHNIIELLESCQFLAKRNLKLMLVGQNLIGNNLSPDVFLTIQDNSKHKSFELSLCLARTQLRKSFPNWNQMLELLTEDNGFFQLDRLYRHQQIRHQRESFTHAVEIFVRLYQYMEELILSREQFCALVLDMHDRNRNYYSVKHDDRLKKLISKTLKQTFDALGAKRLHDRYTWSDVIKSIIILHSNTAKVKSNKNDLYDTRILFTRKRTIEKMERIYGSIPKEESKDGARTELNKYLDAQVASLNSIMPFLQLDFLKGETFFDRI
jgi:hypothetical protein